ncbi:hypothetical protein MNB_SV-14-43 [hydrothermal vent metagenome]|uniref:Uncharacterized protein n=1 Tax=hydrothermal vent metagenome TaxID=652676 RepID=A0A1W1CCW5_9ZZZZ
MASDGSFFSLASRSESVTINTLAVEPRCEPFPPIPTPIANAHQSGITGIPCDSKLSKIGTIAAVKGILSIIADRKAEPHIKIRLAIKRSERTNGSILLPKYSKKWVCSTPPIITKSDIKKLSSVISILPNAPSISVLGARKRRSVRPNVATIQASQPKA